MELTTDWLYNEERLALRERCLSFLLREFGSELSEEGTPLHSTESIYNCAHDWVSQGNATTDGLFEYFEDYYHRD